MKKIIFTLVIIATGLSAHSTPAYTSFSIEQVHELMAHSDHEKGQPFSPKDSCIQICTANRNGKNVLLFKRVCNFNIQIAVEIWCKYELINVKTGKKYIRTIDLPLNYWQTEQVVEWVQDTLYEYGEILDYAVYIEDHHWTGYLEAYTIDDKRLPFYDIEIRKNYDTDQYYAKYYSGCSERGALDVKICPIVFSSYDHFSFSMEGIYDNGRKTSKDVTIELHISKHWLLNGTMNIDRQTNYYFTMQGLVYNVYERQNCGNMIIIYKGTGGGNIIQ